MMTKRNFFGLRQLLRRDTRLFDLLDYSQDQLLSRFTHAMIQARTAPVAKDGREKIERGNIRMRDFRNVPGKREMRQLGGKFLVYLTPAKLRRFRGNKYWLK